MDCSLGTTDVRERLSLSLQTFLAIKLQRRTVIGCDSLRLLLRSTSLIILCSLGREKREALECTALDLECFFIWRRDDVQISVSIKRIKVSVTFDLLG